MKNLMVLFLMMAAFFFSLNASDGDISTDMYYTDLYYTGEYYQGEKEVQTQQILLPANFDYETANQEFLLAREEGNIEKANLLSLQINTYWKENRVESFDPSTHGTNESNVNRNASSSNGSIMYRNNEENSNNSPSIPYWFDDVRIDPRDGIAGTSLVSLSNGELYCLSRYNDGNWNLLIRRSVDGGLTWTTFWDHGFSSGVTINDPRIVECHDTLIISYIIYQPSYGYRTWTAVTAPGNSYNPVSSGSSSGWVDARIVDYRICASIYSYAYICATWIEKYGPTNSYDSTRVMYAKANGCNVSSWVIGPDRIVRTTGGGSNNIYFDDSRIANGSGGKLWVVACLHPNLYPTTYDENIRGLYSTDFGSSWSSTVQITPRNNGIDEYQPSIAGSHINNNWVLLTTTSDTGNTYKRIRNYYSTDNGTNWTNVAWATSYENFLPDVWVDDNSTAFFGACRRDVSSGEVVWYKQGNINDPSSWTANNTVNDDNSNLSNSYGPSVAYNYATGDAIIAWTNFAGSVYSIWFDDESWSLGVEETPVEVSGGMVVLSPNPSKDFASLSYSVVNEGHVNISIYDASGRMVENLVDAVKQTGQHSLTINNENLSSGFYFIRIVTPDGVNTENMRVVK